ncbi:Ger(x)C family spore germination protein [Bacillus sp. 2205SS5-2]|uniref:Ger(x)C family spore germination protein n=1 Tax=Bacillus sp. 2205SS5-2 TaxID=3109031 RepID=UPI003004A05C
MKRHFKLMVVFLVTLPLLTSCVQTQYIETLGLSTAVGYDITGDQLIHGTIVIHQFDPQQSEISKVITADAHTSKGIRQKLNLKTSKSLVSGQLRVSIYGKELAEKGVSYLGDTLSRDAAIGNMLFLAIADTKANDILSFKSEEIQGNMGTYLYNLIKQNIKMEIINDPTLHTFLTNLLDVGVDPMLPILSIDKDEIRISSLGVFVDDHLVGELPIEDLFFFNILMDNYQSGTLELKLNQDNLKKYFLSPLIDPETQVESEEELYVTINNIQTQNKIKIGDQTTPTFDIDLKLKMEIIEMTQDMDLGDPKTIEALTKEINKQIKKKVKKSISDLQNLNSDVVGFGRYYRAKVDSSLTLNEWRKIYQHTQINVEVNGEIARTGVID